MQIAIIENSNQQWIDARELHNELEIDKNYTDWIKVQINRGGFVDEKDFNKVKPDEVYPLKVDSDVGFNPSRDKSKIKFNTGKQGGRPSAIYIITIETAKHISMMSNTSKGKQAREYFIDIEKKYKNPVLSNDEILARAFFIASDSIKKLTDEAKKNKSKVDFYDKVVDSRTLLSMKQTADLLKMGRNRLFGLLRDWNMLASGGYNHNSPYARHINSGFFEVKPHIFHRGYTDHLKNVTFVTPKGLVYIQKRLARLDKTSVS